MSDAVITPLSTIIIDKIQHQAQYPGDDEKEYCMQNLRQWLASTPYLPQNLSDDYIYRYLFGCKFNLQEAKTKLEGYLLLRAQHPQIYSNPDVNEFKTTGVYLSVLPNTTVDGCRVYCIYDNSDDYDLNVVLKNFLMLTQYVAHHERHPVYGFIIMMKAENMSLKKYLKWTPMLIKLSIENIKNTPEAMKGIFILDAPDYVKSIMDLVKKFASQKISERMYFNEPQKLFEILPKDMVPHEFGGDAASITKMAGKILHHFDQEMPWFQEHEAYKADLDLYKQTNKEAVVDTFGVQGSFKKLAVD